MTNNKTKIPEVFLDILTPANVQHKYNIVLACFSCSRLANHRPIPSYGEIFHFITLIKQLPFNQFKFS